MDLGLKGRRALVMGASKGLGRSIANSLAAEGAALVISGRDQAARRGGGGAARGGAARAGRARRRRHGEAMDALADGAVPPWGAWTSWC